MADISPKSVKEEQSIDGSDNYNLQHSAYMLGLIFYEIIPCSIRLILELLRIGFNESN